VPTITTVPAEPFVSLNLFGISGGAYGNPCPEDSIFSNTSLNFEQSLQFYWLLNRITIQATISCILPSNSGGGPSTFETTQTTYSKYNIDMGYTSSSTPRERVCGTGLGDVSLANLGYLEYVSLGERGSIIWYASLNIPKINPDPFQEDFLGQASSSYALGVYTSTFNRDYIIERIPVTVPVFGGFQLYVTLERINEQSGAETDGYRLEDAECVDVEICEIAEE
jgi:hypothetical protein